VLPRCSFGPHAKSLSVGDRKRDGLRAHLR
jgi:hypothetical protein